MPNDQRKKKQGQEPTATLSPLMQKFIDELGEDKKRLLKDKSFESPAQLRTFVGTFIIPRMVEMFTMLGAGMGDIYALAVQNARQLRQLNAMVLEVERRVDGGDGGYGNVAPELVDDLQQAFYTLGNLLRKKLPKDTAVSDAYNKCAEIIGEIQDAVAEPSDDGDDDDASDDGDDGEPSGDDDGDDDASDDGDSNEEVAEAEPSPTPEDDGAKSPEEL